MSWPVSSSAPMLRQRFSCTSSMPLLRILANQSRPSFFPGGMAFGSRANPRGSRTIDSFWGPGDEVEAASLEELGAVIPASGRATQGMQVAGELKADLRETNRVL